MEVVLFKDLTTEDHLSVLEVEAASYKGLYVDMNNAPERKYVKDGSKKISDLIKKVDRARIDKSAKYKSDVSNEAKSITDRLVAANKPFTLLIDEYNTERAKVLAEEKARKKAIEDTVKLEADHEFALLMNDKFDSEFDKRALDAKVESETLKTEQQAREDQAAERAKNQEIQRQEDERQKLELENAHRAADAQNQKDAHNAILSVLVEHGLSDEHGRKVVNLLAKGVLPKATINY